MKFINYLSSIAGIEIYPLVSFLMFFLFFLILSVWVAKVSNTHIDTMKNIPLDEKEKNQSANN